MTKRYNDQVCLKLTGQLRVALEQEAAADGRGLSGLIRMVLIKYAAQRITEYAIAANATGAGTMGLHLQSPVETERT